MLVQETHIVKDSNKWTTLYRCIEQDRLWPHDQRTVWMLRHMHGFEDRTTGLRPVSEEAAQRLIATP